MAAPITLHELIQHVKEELLTPLPANSADDLYPFLYVDEVEITAQVTISDKMDNSGKLTIYVAEVSLGGDNTIESGNTLRVKLSPLVSKEEIRKRLQVDERLWRRLEMTAQQATLKQIPLAEG